MVGQEQMILMFRYLRERLGKAASFPYWLCGWNHPFNRSYVYKSRDVGDKVASRYVIGFRHDFRKYWDILYILYSVPLCGRRKSLPHPQRAGLLGGYSKMKVIIER